jgi:two-component system sensor histidine kinase YesM
LDGGATITIRGRLEGENVVLEVEDTGVGMTPEQIAQVTTYPSSSLQVGGYGVYNAIQRIKTYYGPEYGIEYFSQLGKGTLARITIPKNSNVEMIQM